MMTHGKRWVGFPAILLVVVVSLFSAAAAERNVLSFAEGAWELDPSENEELGDFQCSKAPLNITIDKTTLRYTAERGGTVWTAEIIDVDEDYFWIHYDEEDRTDADGNLVDWAFVIEDEDHFYWQRSDWVLQADSPRTFLRRRCKQ